jgi:hypothetical protein
VAASANFDHTTCGADYSNSMQRSATERKRETLAHRTKGPSKLAFVAVDAARTASQATPFNCDAALFAP